MEFIIINGERVAIPPDVVSEGRDAVHAWVQAEAGKRGEPPVHAEPVAHG